MSEAVQLHLQIHQHAVEVSNRYRKSEVELIGVLDQVERYRVYLHFEHASLFKYGITELGLSRDVTYNLITVMRKAREVPELKNEIRNGNIHLSSARKIAPVLTPENKEEWLKKASTLSQRELEKEVVKVRPLSSTPERASYVTESRIKLEVGLYEKDMMRLRHVQNLLSQSKRRACSLEDVLVEMTAFYLKHHDPVERAKRVFVKKGFVRTEHEKRDNAEKEGTQNREKNTNSPKPLVSIRAHAQRIPTPSAVLHQVNLRDQRACAFVNARGEKCGQKRWLEIHHRIPVSQGGVNTLENLITLCSEHHRWMHAQVLRESR